MPVRCVMGRDLGQAALEILIRLVCRDLLPAHALGPRRNGQVCAVDQEKGEALQVTVAVPANHDLEELPGDADVP